jgi:hypothetical protein
MKKSILFVGEHPVSTSGNGGMMASILSTLDAEKYEATCFALESIPVDPSLLVSHTLPIAIISAHDGQDPKGML